MSPVIYQNSCPGSLTILNDLEICFLPISLSLSLYLFFPSNYNLVVIHTRVVMHSNILRIDLVFLLRVFDIFLGISLHFLSLSNLHPPLPVSFFLYICLQCPPTTWYWSDHCSDLQTSSVVPEIFKHPLGQSCRRRRGRERERDGALAIRYVNANQLCTGYHVYPSPPFPPAPSFGLLVGLHRYHARVRRIY